MVVSQTASSSALPPSAAFSTQEPEESPVAEQVLHAHRLNPSSLSQWGNGSCEVDIMDSFHGA